ncbi:MAG: glutamine--fructose-6-phosphate aminotransferase [Gammaproteobacteria bacterium RIFCSPHIGHO2_12_FULL_41_15]|nr:MAG: glutamine--fructose-6-phosphate aminotransferase [Gammaproteobacteria bacterium RIFCSPHIGHO2_12_FULL_41_15]
MCGIVGAIAQRNIVDILIEGLKRLEYRGYDSAGIAVFDKDKQQIHRVRALGKVDKLTELLEETPIEGQLGIAHTRWATHGEPSTHNAHPHASHDAIAIAHNGIIENYKVLKKSLQKAGYFFSSETDSEVIAHLLHQKQQTHQNFLQAIKATVDSLEGAYALAIITHSEPDKIYCVRSGSPLVIGLGIGENFLASDIQALLPVTQMFIYLSEGDIAEITRKDYRIFDSELNIVKRDVHETSVKADSISKGEYRHFMQKEIFQQAQAVTETINGYLTDTTLLDDAFGLKAKALFSTIKRVVIVACGTSYHAGLVARNWIESMAKLPCQVEIASENRYRQYVVEPHTLFVSISQSGETADTLAALRRAKKEGFAATLAICNVPQSSLSRESDIVFLTRAGVEVGVAATKTYVAQLTSMFLLAIALAKHNGLSADLEADYVAALHKLPKNINRVLQLDEQIHLLAKLFVEAENALFIGRGDLYPTALEGALKLKEISYIHAEAYPAGELKHGPLALVDDEMPVIVSIANNALFEKVISNVEEVKARGGIVFAFVDENLTWHKDNSSYLISMPSADPLLAPILHTIPLQLLSYYIAVIKGTDVDQPRNLAKSVTVE